MRQDEILKELRESLEAYGNGPKLSQMHHRTLEEKGIAGSTAAHVIEELHTPHNYAYVTFTTGTSAFQNIVGVTLEELPERKKVGKKVLDLAGIHRGDKVLITYPPLVNVFSGDVFRDNEIQVIFMERPSRDALLLALCEEKPRAVIGESGFLRCGIEDAKRLGLLELIPDNLIMIAAGTPLDLELPAVTKHLQGAQLHDLYGCQEFGWLLMDGVPLRDDIVLIPCGEQNRYVHVIVGGIATGDMFAAGEHLLNPNGKIATYAAHRCRREWVTTICRTTALDSQTMDRLSRSILRMKGKIIQISDELCCGADELAVTVMNPDTGDRTWIKGSTNLRLLSDLLLAQMHYQKQDKKDPVWQKGGDGNRTT